MDKKESMFVLQGYTRRKRKDKTSLLCVSLESVMTKLLLLLFVGLVISLVVAYYNFLPLLPSRKKKISAVADTPEEDEQGNTNFNNNEESNAEQTRVEPPDLPKSFMIEESDFCHRHKDLQVIAYVHSAINETEKRKLTRETWVTAKDYDKNVKVGVVFMVGRAKTDEEQHILQEESNRYHDIVQGNYTDTYHLLSYKALASLVWVARHCSHIPWMLHADDDVIVDLFLISRLLKMVGDKDKFLCYVWESSIVRREGRWHVREREFPETEYPPYCSGAVWILPTSLIRQLLHATIHTSLLWVDDVYVTGILASKAGIGHSKLGKQYFSKDNIKNNSIGKKVSWVHIPDRKSWWRKILSHYGYEG